MFERSQMGDFVSKTSVTVLPAHFLYIGRQSTSTLIEWVVLIGHIAIAIASAFFILGYTLIKLINRDSLSTYVDIHYVGPLTIATLCLVSFWLQISVAFSNPLIAVDLGTTKTVNLSYEADVFNAVNRLNSIQITLVMCYLLIGHWMPRTGMKKLWSTIGVLVLYTIAIAVVLLIRWPTIFSSFRITFFFMIRLLMAGVGHEELETVRNFGGFFMTLILIVYVFGVYWLIGLAIGTVMYTMKRTGGNIAESTFVATVKDSKITEKTLELMEKISGGKYEPKGTFNTDNCTEKEAVEIHPDILAQITSAAADRSTAVAAAVGGTAEMDDEEFLASIEVLAGRALGEISELKSDMDSQLKEARNKLDLARYQIRESYRYITQTRQETNDDN